MLVEEHHSDHTYIHSYHDNALQISLPDSHQKTTLSRNIILSPFTLQEDLLPPCYHDLTLSHLQRIDYTDTEIILLSSGKNILFPPSKIIQFFVQQQTGLEVMDIGAACRTFNLLVTEHRPVLALLFLT